MQGIDKHLADFMRTREFREKVESDHILFTIPPVSLTYALERLTIVHVRLWMLEDEARRKDIDDAKLGEIKRKIDWLNGHVRPRIVESIGQMFAAAVKSGNEDLVREPNFKKYGDE